MEPGFSPIDGCMQVPRVLFRFQIKREREGSPQTVLQRGKAGRQSARLIWKRNYFRIPSRFEKLSVQGLKPGRGTRRSPPCRLAGRLAALSGRMNSAQMEWLQ